MDQLVYTLEPNNGAFQVPLGVSIKRLFDEHLATVGNAEETDDQVVRFSVKCHILWEKETGLMPWEWLRADSRQHQV